MEKQNLSSKKIKETATLQTKPDLITIPSEDAHSRLKLVFPSLTDKVTPIYITSISPQQIDYFLNESQNNPEKAIQIISKTLIDCINKPSTQNQNILKTKRNYNQLHSPSIVNNNNNNNTIVNIPQLTQNNHLQIKNEQVKETTQQLPPASSSSSLVREIVNSNDDVDMEMEEEIEKVLNKISEMNKEDARMYLINYFTFKNDTESQVNLKKDELAKVSQKNLYLLQLLVNKHNVLEKLKLDNQMKKQKLDDVYSSIGNLDGVLSENKIKLETLKTMINSNNFVNIPTNKVIK